MSTRCFFCLALAGLLGALPRLGRAQNVGIGTIAPTQSLDVNGSLRVRGLSGPGETRLPRLLPDGTLTSGPSLPAFLPNGGTAPAPGSAPVSTGSGSGPYALALSGSYLYVACKANNTLRTYSLANPLVPVLVGSPQATGASPSGLAVAGIYLYVSQQGSDNLRVYSLATPASPVAVGSAVATGDQPDHCAVAGNYLYVCNFGSSTLQTYSLSNPAAPVSVGTVATGQEPHGVVAVGNYLYVSNATDDNIQTYSLSNPAAPASLGTTPAGDLPAGLATADGYLYAAILNENRLQVFNLSPPTAPVPGGSVATAAQPNAVVISQGYAYVASLGANAIQAYLVGPPALLGFDSSGQLTSVPLPAGDNLGNHTAILPFDLQANVLRGSGADLGTAVGLGVRADGGLNIGQNTVHENISLGYRAGETTGTGAYNTFLGREAGRENDAGYSNMFLGYWAGRGNTSGFNNMFIGNGAGLSNQAGSNNIYLGNGTGALGEAGQRNILVGNSSGAGLTGAGNLMAGHASGSQALAAQRNVVLGDSAGLRLANGSLNVLIGYQAGLNNTASQNHFVGYQAGLSNTTGTNNHFDGYQAGKAATTGDFNTAVGYRTGRLLDDGYSNTFLGWGAGQATSSGHGNLFAGVGSGYGNQQGADNVMLGNGTGFVSNGDRNVFVGAAAAQDNAAGEHNTALGYGSGPSVGGLANAAGIGYNAEVSQSNSLVLGGTGADAVKVGIGTAAPNSRLSLSPAAVEPKITLWDGGSPSSHYGFGVSSSQLNYHVATAGNAHVFSAGGKNGDGTELARLTGTGRLGLGSPGPTATLEVRRGTGPDGTATFWGSTRVSHFSYGTAENTYLRGGKAGSYVLLNDNGGNVGVRTDAPNSGLQVASSLSVPFRAVYQTAGSYVNVTATDDDHTLRSGSPNGVVGAAVFGFLLPNPVGHGGRVYVLLNYGDTPVNLYANNGSTAFATNLIYDDGTSAYLTQMPANARLTLQSDGGTWIVLAR